MLFWLSEFACNLRSFSEKVRRLMTYVNYPVVFTYGYRNVVERHIFLRMIFFFYRIKKGLDVEQATVEKDVEAEYKVGLAFYFVHV
jgi:hypothetical protein